MNTNMGRADKLIRLIVAATIAMLFLTHILTGTIGIVLLIVAGIFILTSLIGFCPLYRIFGINTCPAKK